MCVCVCVLRALHKGCIEIVKPVCVSVRTTCSVNTPHGRRLLTNERSWINTQIYSHDAHFVFSGSVQHDAGDFRRMTISGDAVALRGNG